jgi:hypothetical protein
LWGWIRLLKTWYLGSSFHASKFWRDNFFINHRNATKLANA